MTKVRPTGSLTVSEAKFKTLPGPHALFSNSFDSFLTFSEHDKLFGKQPSSLYFLTDR